MTELTLLLLLQARVDSMVRNQCCQGHQGPLRTACAALAITLAMAHPAQAFTSTGYVPPPANQQMGVDDQVTSVM